MKPFLSILALGMWGLACAVQAADAMPDETLEGDCLLRQHQVARKTLTSLDVAAEYQRLKAKDEEKAREYFYAAEEKFIVVQGASYTEAKQFMWDAFGHDLMTGRYDHLVQTKRTQLAIEVCMANARFLRDTDPEASQQWMLALVTGKLPDTPQEKDGLSWHPVLKVGNDYTSMAFDDIEGFGFKLVAARSDSLTFDHVHNQWKVRPADDRPSVFEGETDAAFQDLLRKRALAHVKSNFFLEASFGPPSSQMNPGNIPAATLEAYLWPGDASTRPMLIVRHFDVQQAFVKTFDRGSMLSTDERLWIVLMDTLWAQQKRGRLPLDLVMVVQSNEETPFPRLNGFLMNDLLNAGMRSADGLKQNLLETNHPVSGVLHQRFALCEMVASLRVPVSATNRPRKEIIPGTQCEVDGQSAAETHAVGGRGAPHEVQTRLQAQLAREKQKREEGRAAKGKEDQGPAGKKEAAQ